MLKTHLLFFLPFFVFLFLSNSSQVKTKTDTECPYISFKGDRRINKNSLRIIQYNVEWLFVDYYSAFDCPGSKCTWNNESEALTHLNYVSNVIKELDPDIINLCEVEGCDELNMLINNLDSSYMPYLKKGTDTSTGQNVGLLTRIDPIIDLYRTEDRYTYPIENSTCGYTGNSGTEGVSKHYITEFNINGNLNIAFIGAHFLANPTDPTRCAEREAQAQVLQKYIYNYTQQGYEIVMIGDFNDFDKLVPDMNNNIPTSKVLDILKGYYGSYAGKYELFSAAQDVPQYQRYSDWWDPNEDCISESNEFSVIDHILLSKNLREKVFDVFFYHGYDEFCGKYNSDHYPVVLDLIL